MKKYFILLAFVLTTFICKAQSNLQLSQVLTYNGTLNQNQSSPTWTVPNGKVWKVEARTSDCLKINGSWYTGTSNFANNGYMYGSTSQSFPIWLKSGDNIWYQNGNATVNGLDYFISILEFNLTQ